MMKRTIRLLLVEKAESIIFGISNRSGHACILNKVFLCLNELISTRHEQAVMTKEEPHKNEMASERSLLQTVTNFWL